MERRGLAGGAELPWSGGVWPTVPVAGEVGWLNT